MKKITIYTDGACSYNPGPGGIGVYLQYNDQSKQINGYFPQTTNNQMELMAVIVALDQLKESCNIDLHTDSKYLSQGMNEWLNKWKNNNWKSSNKKKIKNQTLWKKIDTLNAQHNIKFIWVKAHADTELNNLVDKLATTAVKNQAPILNNYLHLLDQDL